MFAESKATTWTELCGKPGLLAGSCYSCCLPVKCGGAEVLGELLIPLLCLNQHPFCGVSRPRFGEQTISAHASAPLPSFWANFSNPFCRQNKCRSHRAVNLRYKFQKSERERGESLLFQKDATVLFNSKARNYPAVKTEMGSTAVTAPASSNKAAATWQTFSTRELTHLGR